MAYAGIEVELREVVLKDKPGEMLAASQKGTVPVLKLDDGSVIDESIDVMLWALNLDDPDSWLRDSSHAAANALIAENDGPFKIQLDKYKYADRHPAQTPEHYRDQACLFLEKLEQRLAQSDYLLGADLRLADVAIFPFIRQFAAVDSEWFDQSTYPQLRRWLNEFLESALFRTVMTKHPKWESQQVPVIFPNKD